VYCIKLLNQILKANSDVLKTLKLSKDYTNLGLSLPEGSTLADLINNVKEQEYAWPAFSALWNELTTVPGRPPLIVTIDGLAHIMKYSEYRDPSFKPVHAHDLTLVRLLVDALSGTTPFSTGGAILAAECRSNSPRSRSIDFALAKAAARAAGTEEPKPESYERKYDARVDEALKSVDVLQLEGISVDEARAVIEYWAASGVLKAKVTEREVSEKWTVAGSGNFGEMERATLANMRLY
jgi:small subunit ribosomal protein S29